MASATWSFDLVFEFLEHYRNEPILWDPKHLLHKNRTEVNDAWIRIQNNFSISSTIPELKKKKESLMATFRMHMRRKNKAHKYKTTWFAFTIMENFLGKVYDDNYNETEKTSNTDDEQPHIENSYITLKSVKANQSLNSNTSVHNEYNTDRQSKLSKPLARKWKSSNSSHSLSKNDVDTTNYDKSCDHITELDEYDLYGQLLVKKLRKLDEHQRDVAMHEIDNTMFRAKMKSQSAKHESFSSSPTQRKISSPVFITTHEENPISYEEEIITYEEHNV